MSMLSTRFLFAVCQVGAESVLKREVARSSPDIHPAFSRPGFVTFKVPADRTLAEDFRLRTVFARTQGFSLGQATGSTDAERADAVSNLIEGLAFDQLHVWERDRVLPGDRGFEPGETQAAIDVGLTISRACRMEPTEPNRIARPGDRVLDCILVERDQWWIGGHVATDEPSRWPGGMPRLELPAHAVSRAYLKMEESLRWFRLPVKPGDRCVELGSAPGGSCQALLDRGLRTTGIDPAEMDPAVLEHENFTHIRARGADLKRREYRKFKWLFADSNVTPKHSLDTIEHIVTHRQVNIRGMIITLKLTDWEQADSIPEYSDRVRSWGFGRVDVRQLCHNRREICLGAIRRAPAR